LPDIRPRERRQHPIKNPFFVIAAKPRRFAAGARVRAPAWRFHQQQLIEKVAARNAARTRRCAAKEKAS